MLTHTIKIKYYRHHYPHHHHHHHHHHNHQHEQHQQKIQCGLNFKHLSESTNRIIILLIFIVVVDVLPKYTLAITSGTPTCDPTKITDVYFNYNNNSISQICTRILLSHRLRRLNNDAEGSSGSGTVQYGGQQTGDDFPSNFKRHVVKRDLNWWRRHQPDEPKNDARFLVLVSKFNEKLQKIRKFLKITFHALKFLTPEIKLFGCLLKFFIIQFPEYIGNIDVENLSMGNFLMNTMGRLMANQTYLFDADDTVIKNNNQIGNKIHQLTISDYVESRNNENFYRAQSSSTSSSLLKSKPLLSNVNQWSILRNENDNDDGNDGFMVEEQNAQNDFYHPRSRRPSNHHHHHEYNNGNHVMGNSKKPYKNESHQSSSRRNDYKNVMIEADKRKSEFLKKFTFMTCAKIYFFHLFLRMAEEYILAA